MKVLGLLGRIISKVLLSFMVVIGVIVMVSIFISPFILVRDGDVDWSRLHAEVRPDDSYQKFLFYFECSASDLPLRTDENF